jgi:hypothetical protein
MAQQAHRLKQITNPTQYLDARRDEFNVHLKNGWFSKAASIIETAQRLAITSGTDWHSISQAWGERPAAEAAGVPLILSS